MKAPIHRFVFHIAKFMALLSGVLLLCMIALTCISVMGRLINSFAHVDFFKTNFVALGSFLKHVKPIYGDYEWVQMGLALAVFAALPWCQLQRAHASVMLTSLLLPRKMSKFLAVFWEAVFFIVQFVLCWRLSVGMMDKRRYGQTSFLLEMPVWWAYGLCAFLAALGVIVALYSTVHVYQEERKNHE